MKVAITKMSYSVNNGDLFLHIYGRGEDKKKKHIIVKDTIPWFCVDKDPHTIIANSKFVQERVARAYQYGEDLYGNKLWRIETHYPGQVGSERDGIRQYFSMHYEADIPFKDRMRIDFGIQHGIEVPEDNRILKPSEIQPCKIDIPLRIQIMDIEVSEKKGRPTPEKPEGEVVSVVIYDSYMDAYIIFVVGEVDKDIIKVMMLKELEKHGIKEEFKKFAVFSFDSEDGLFTAITKFMDDNPPDIATGWYFCEFRHQTGFDFPYMKARAYKMGYDWVNPTPYQLFDLMVGYQRRKDTKVPKSLQEAGETELGIGKIPRKKIYEMLDGNEWEDLVVYNWWDVLLCKMLNDEEAGLGLLKFQLNLAKFVGCDLRDSFFNSKMVDMYILHVLSKSKIVLPSREFLKYIPVDKGASVAPPVKGLFDNVVVFDITAQYASIIMTFNLSPETRLKDMAESEDETAKPRPAGEQHQSPSASDIYILPSGNKYWKEPKGLLPTIAEQLFLRRKQLKKERDQHPKDTVQYKSLHDQQRIVKFFMASLYGVMASRFYRLADGKLASDITGFARILVKWMWDYAKSEGFRPLYSDTDSILVQIEGELEEVVDKSMKIIEEMNEGFTELVEQYGVSKEACRFTVKVDRIGKWFQSSISKGGKLKGKKRHAGVSDWIDGKGDVRDVPFDDRLTIKGFEYRRMNTAEITKEAQKFVFETIFTKGVNELRKPLKQYYDDIMEGKYKNEIMLPATYNPDVKTNTAHFRAVKYSNQYLDAEIMDGDDYKWCYVKGVKGAPLTDVVATEFDSVLSKDVVVDYQRMAERTLLSPLERILDGVGLSWSEILQGQEQTGLFRDYW